MYKLLGVALVTFGLMAGSVIADEYRLSDEQMDVVTAAGPSDLGGSIDVEAMKGRSIDVEAIKLDGMVNKRAQMFNVLKALIGKYDESAQDVLKGAL